MGTPVINYVPTDRVGFPAFSESRTYATSAGVYPPVQFGMEADFRDAQSGTGNAGGARAVFCMGSNVVSAGQWVQVINNSAVLLTNANSLSNYPIGIAGAPMSATNVCGWVGVIGKFDNAAFTNVAAATGARLFLPAGTAGQIATTCNASNDYLEVRGIHIPNSFTSADGSATAVGYRALTVNLNRPWMLMRSATNAAW